MSTILQDIMGMIKRRLFISTPSDEDFFFISKKTTSVKKELKPEPEADSNLIKAKDLKSYVIQDTKFIIPRLIEGSGGDVFDLTACDDWMVYLKHTGVGNATYQVLLPDATSATYKYRVIRFISDASMQGSNHAELVTFNGQDIDESSSNYQINQHFEGITLWSDGTRWIVIQAKAH